MKTEKLFFIAASLGIVTLLPACSSQPDNKVSDAPVQVEVYSPSQHNASGITVSGQLTAKQTATVSTRMMGYIKKVYVKPGDAVRAGQLLLTVSGDDIIAKKQQVQAMIAEAQAAEQHAKRDYERFKTLRQQNSVSDKELENVELQYTSMKAKLQMAREAMNEVNVQLAYSNITAPFAGVVTQKLVDEGSMANPGMPLLVVEQQGALVVQASIPETYIQYVKTGDQAAIKIKSLNQTLAGKIAELSPSAYGTGGQYLMKVVPTEKWVEGVHSGMFAELWIDKSPAAASETSSKLLVDNKSLIYRDQLTGVYVAEQNQAILKWIRLGKQYGEQSEVVSGIDKNDRIILNPQGKLYNGRTISISDK